METYINLSKGNTILISVSIENEGSKAKPLSPKNSTDPYYKRIVAPDEAKFFDWTKTSIAFGWEESYVENGQPRVSKGGLARL